MVSFQQNVKAKANPVRSSNLGLKAAVPPIARVKNLYVILQGQEEYQEDVKLADGRWQVSIYFLLIVKHLIQQIILISQS